jgi:pimeloyl-ACP methyl ester carboxylesterase
LKPANLSGTDEYTIVKSADGYKIAGNTNLKTSNGPMTFMHSEEVAPDWTMISYKLVATGNGASQSVELIRIGDHITAAAKVGEQTVPKEIAWKPNTLVLDNFIAAHFQVLLNAIAAAKPESKSNWNLIVAQRLTEAFGKVNPKTETASGTLDGKQISLKKYSLELGGLLVEIWADAASNQFMRAYIPLQQFEIAREGFELTVPKAIEVFPSNCNERDASFMSGSLKVPATFCLPKMEKAGTKLPIVVLVHGSGPHDRDETIGPNKPFKDLAEDLAANGIATLRYEKRTYFAKQSFTPTSTEEDEVITDAIAALTAASKLPEAGSIFLLGHSLGGAMAPFIANRYGKVDGIILMAAAAVPLDETIERQTAAQLNLAGMPQAEIDARVNDLKQKFADIRSGKLTGSQPVFGAPAAYWANLFQHDVPAELKKVTVPVLVLQGGKDIQVVKADYELIQRSLAGKRAQFEWLPGLNHLFMTVDGPSTGAEYGKPGHVSPEVIMIISKWVESRADQ